MHRCAPGGRRPQRPFHALRREAQGRHAGRLDHHAKHALHDRRATSSPTGDVPSVVAIVHRSRADCRLRATCVRGPLPIRTSIERSGDVPHTVFGFPLVQSVRRTRAHRCAKFLATSRSRTRANGSLIACQSSLESHRSRLTHVPMPLLGLHFASRLTRHDPRREVSDHSRGGLPLEPSTARCSFCFSSHTHAHLERPALP